MTTHLSVVCIQEEDSDLYVAQCVEYDLSAEGETPAEALEAFFEMIEARVEAAKAMGCGPFDHVPPPPEDLVAWIKEMQADEPPEYMN